jgi:NtrC-family two-component system response regulator AlgB
MPPLRDRPEDILLLARHYLQVLATKQGRADLSFSPLTEAAMQSYPWPGNLRELRNAVERAIILAPGKVLEPHDLGLPSETFGVPAQKGASLLGSDVSLEEIEREHIARVIARAVSLEGAAKTLGIDATTLQRKRKKYGLA